MDQGPILRTGSILLAIICLMKVKMETHFLNKGPVVTWYLKRVSSVAVHFCNC